MRTLLDRNEAITTRDEDKIKEEEHIQGALAKCGYPKWTIERVKKQRAQSKEDKTRLKDKSTNKSAGLVGLPYVPGLSESFARILKRHGISSYMKPVNTLRQCLVHPKDKRPTTDNAGVIYKIPCKQCPGQYIGETGRRLKVRLGEHQDDVTKAEQVARHYTRAQRKKSEQKYNKSALTDHVTQVNHTIDWDSTKIVGREDDHTRRLIKETIKIRQEKQLALNRDGGNYPLPHLWGPLLDECLSSKKPSNRGAVNTQQSTSNIIILKKTTDEK